MKEGIHPNYLPATVGCACGNVVVTRSTRGDFQVDVCAACHPFYTGTQKLIDAAGRVDRFRRRYGAGGAPKGGKPVATPSDAPPAASAAPVEAAPVEAAPAEAPAAD